MNNELDRESIVKNLYHKRSSKQVLFEAIKEIYPRKGTRLANVIIVFFAIIFSLVISLSESTVVLLRDVVELLNGTVLAIFAIVFTGYAFFQALVSPRLLKRMMSIEKDSKPMFLISNDYFVNVMIINVVAIILNTILLIFLKIIPDSWSVFPNLYVNNGIASFLVTFYFYFQILNIWELKSFIFNVYQLFNIAAGEQVIELLDEEDKKNHE